VAGPFVVRDLELELAMGPGVTARVPMHLVYEITEEDGALKVCHLRAHWEMLPMVRQVLRNGWPGLMVLNRLGLRLIAQQGVGAVVGFSRALLGMHETGKIALRRFVDAVNRKDPRGPHAPLRCAQHWDHLSGRVQMRCARRIVRASGTLPVRYETDLLRLCDELYLQRASG